jgi:anti-sigma factor (TIGR02949 family)
MDSSNRQVMGHCSKLEARLTAYIDGEASAEDCAAVAAHLADCCPCRQRAAVEKAVRQVLRVRSATLRSGAPEALRARCLALAKARRRGRKA